MLGKKGFLLMSGIVLVGGFGLWFWQKNRLVAVRTAIVKRQKVVEVVDAAGGVTESAQEQTIFAPLGGTVAEIYFGEGDRVKAGDKIAQFDKVPFELAKKQAWANYVAARSAKEQAFRASPLLAEFQAAKATADAARFSLDQAQRTYNDNPTDVNKSALNTAVANYQTTWSKVKRLQNQMIDELQIQHLEAAQNAALAAYEKAKTDLAKTEIFAEKSGTLIFETNPMTTAKVKAGQAVSLGQVLFSIADLKQVEFVADLDEVDLGRVSLGQAAQVELDAYPEQVFAGRVSFLAPLATLQASGERAVEVRIKLENLKDPLKLGLSGSAKIRVAEKQGVLAIPQEAFFFENGAEWVWTVENQRARKQKVELGEETDGLVEVLGGLKEGQVLVVKPLDKMEEGRRVRSIQAEE